MAMQPEEQTPPQGGAPEQKGDAQALVEGIYSGLQQFQEMLQGAAPELSEKLAMVMQGFQQIVEELVGGSQGQGGGPPPQKGPPGPRGPSAGGPGAVPM